MPTYDFRYKDPRFLNEFAMLIIDPSVKNSRFSVTLMPDIEELLDVIEGRRQVEFGEEATPKGMEGYRQQSRLRKKAYNTRIQKLCEEHKVIPFTELELSRIGSSPKIKFLGYNSYQDDEANAELKEFSDELQRTSLDPIKFLLGKWYMITFEEIKDYESDDEKRQIEKLHQAVGGLIKEEYRVTHISGTYNPRLVTHDHYYDSEECDGSFYSHGGSIHINVPFNLPEDFDIERAVKTAGVKSLEGLAALPFPAAAGNQ